MLKFLRRSFEKGVNSDTVRVFKSKSNRLTKISNGHYLKAHIQTPAFSSKYQKTNRQSADVASLKNALSKAPPTSLFKK